MSEPPRRGSIRGSDAPPGRPAGGPDFPALVQRTCCERAARWPPAGVHAVECHDTERRRKVNHLIRNDISSSRRGLASNLSLGPIWLHSGRWSHGRSCAVGPSGGPLLRATAPQTLIRQTAYGGSRRRDRGWPAETPRRHPARVADTPIPRSRYRLVGPARGEIGPRAVLVNTIGTFRQGDALSTTPEGAAAQVDVNLGPAAGGYSAVGPHMKAARLRRHRARGGAPAIEATRRMAAYSCKAALVHLTRSLTSDCSRGASVKPIAPQLLVPPPTGRFPVR